MAYRHPLVGAPGVGFHGGPVILDPGHQGLRHTRYHRPVDRFDGYEAVTDRLPGDYVYAGPIYHHFGHVMAEMVHRLLPSRESLAGRRLLFVETGDATYRTGADVPAFLREVLGFFDIGLDQICFLADDRVVDGLFVAQQGSDFGGGPRPGYLEALTPYADRALGEAKMPGHDKVYVSRSALPGGGGLLGERYVEAALEQVGFFIARPETMPLRQQMTLYRRAKVLVFGEGSACHGVELLGAGALGTVMLLARREDHMEIFGKVLASRAAEYVAIPPAPGTTSIFRRMTHITVGPMAVRALFERLRERSVCAPVLFDAAAYQAAAESDLRDHIAYHSAANPAEVDPALVTIAAGCLPTGEARPW